MKSKSQKVAEARKNAEALKAKKKLKKEIFICGDLHENYADALKYYRFSNTFPGNILISQPKWQATEKDWISKLDRAIVVVNEMKQRISKYIDKEKNYSYIRTPNLSSMFRRMSIFHPAIFVRKKLSYS